MGTLWAFFYVSCTDAVTAFYRNVHRVAPVLSGHIRDINDYLRHSRAHTIKAGKQSTRVGLEEFAVADHWFCLATWSFHPMYHALPRSISGCVGSDSGQPYGWLTRNITQYCCVRKCYAMLYCTPSHPQLFQVQVWRLPLRSCTTGGSPTPT
jgi:hypothetical protein